MNARERSAAAWDEAPPDWVAALADAIDGSTQRAVAARVGYSASVVSEILARRYRGNLRAVEEKVRAALMGEQVDCPVAGPIRKAACFEHQVLVERGVRSSERRIRLARACPACPHWRGRASFSEGMQT